jgi:hypothetical protein
MRHRDHAKRLNEVWLVEHLPFELYCARSTGSLEGIDNCLSLPQFLFVWRVAGVDGVDLVWMNGDLAGEPGSPRRPHLAFEASAVAEIRRDGIDSLHTCCVSTEQAKGARELVRELVFAAVEAIGAGAKRRRQVLRAPGQADESR